MFVELGGHVSIVVLPMARFYAFSLRSDEGPLSIYASANRLGVLNSGRVATLTGPRGKGTSSVAGLILLERDPSLWDGLVLLGWRVRRRGDVQLLMGLGPLGAGRTRHDKRRVTDLPVVFVVAAGSGRVGAGDGVVGQVRIVSGLCIQTTYAAAMRPASW